MDCLYFQHIKQPMRSQSCFLHSAKICIEINGNLTFTRVIGWKLNCSVAYYTLISEKLEQKCVGACPKPCKAVSKLIPKSPQCSMGPFCFRKGNITGNRIKSWGKLQKYYSEKTFHLHLMLPNKLRKLPIFGIKLNNPYSVLNFL